MNWDAIGAVGEIAGSVAVVLTLLVLIHQVREGTAATRASTLESIADRVHDRLLIQATDERLAALLVRGDAAGSLSEFDDVEAHRLRHWWASLFNHQQVQFVQHRRGTVSLQDVQFRRAAMVQQMRASAVAQECWQFAKVMLLRPDFIEYVEEGMKEPTVG